jgi:ABC-type multidrug transport system ATPase subunit/sterol desaturase/sphingolipid hydroxylase (fatty acid hydroxylase superfamily)
VSRLETNGYYALGAPLYVALGALELWLARRKGVRAYGFADTLGNVSAGLGEIVIGLFIGPWLLALYDYGFDHIALVRWPEGSPVPWVLAFLLGDLCYYLYHRAGHSVGALWAIHGVHHQTEEFNLSIALRHPWFSDFYSAVFYVPLPLFGVPPTHFFVAITLISFYALSIHSHLLQRPSFYLFVTPRTHVLHHAKNPRYLNKNFGAMLTIWDRLFGTYAEPDPAEPPSLGTTFGYETHDGARSQWIFFRTLIEIARKAPTLGDRIRTFVMPPGWRPKGVAPLRAVPARRDESIPVATKAYTLTALVLTTAFALYVLWLRDHHPFWMLSAASAIILWSLSTIGGLLDGRRSSVRDELLRLAATAVLGAAIARGRVVPGVLVFGAAAASAVWLLAMRRAVEGGGAGAAGGGAVKEIIAAEQLAKRFGAVEALRGVTFALHGPQVVGILGPNGAGKTTLLEILEGISSPTSGTFRLFGATEKRSSYPRRRVGVVLQREFTLDRITVRDYAQLFASIYGVRGGDERILVEAELTARADVAVERLSGGEAQRLFIAAAVVQGPELLFLDEPTAHLDPENKARIGEIIRGMGRSRTVLLSTHDLREAEAVCDHVLFLVDGRVKAEGPKGDLIAAVPAEKRRGPGLEDAFFHFCGAGIGAGGALE